MTCSCWEKLKGNPNFQGILNWIIQILHYYCRKQHKNIGNSWIIEQNIAISLSLLFSLLMAICASLAFLSSRVFSVLGHSFERHKWSFVLHIVSFSALKISFSKVSLGKYHCLHKKNIHIIGISLEFMIFITFKTRDKTCSKMEKAWFLLLQWVAKSSKMNRKMMFILIYLSNNWPSVAGISSHTAWSMPIFTISSSKNNAKEIVNF